MSQRSASADFEAALLAVVRNKKTMATEPALVSLRPVLVLLKRAADPNRETARAAQAIIRDLHRAYEYVRLHDVRRGDGKSLKLVRRFEPAHLPETLADVRQLAADVWPLLPFVSFLHSKRNASAWSSKVKAARLYEYVFVLLCTKPVAMRPWLYMLAGAVIARRRQFPGLDAYDAAEAVVAGFERRALPVSRYKAKAKTIEDAARNVQRYMTGAIKRRVNDEVRRLLEPEIDVPASTQRRWKQKYGVTVSSPDAAAEARATMSERRKHAPRDRLSVASLAKHFDRSRTTVLKALREAERLHGFAAERGTDGTFLVTLTQARRVHELLPARRRRK